MNKVILLRPHGSKDKAIVVSEPLYFSTVQHFLNSNNHPISVMGAKFESPRKIVANDGKVWRVRKVAVVFLVEEAREAGGEKKDGSDKAKKTD